MTYVYRLLNDDDEPDEGLDAKDSDAEEEVEDHVGHGSKSGYESQYISTSATYEAVYEFTQLTREKYVRVVRINVERLKRLAKKNGRRVKVIDLTDDYVCDKYISGERARSFAERFDEVLIKGHIPASCVRLIYDGKKSKMPEDEPTKKKGKQSEEYEEQFCSAFQSRLRLY